MQIVRIYPNNKHKCHFSIRKLNNKFFVFEGDKVLRTDLPSVNSAETEISLIVLNRKKSGATEIPVKYGEETIMNKIKEEMPEIKKERNHKLTAMDCVICSKEFMSKRSNHLTCSRDCSVKFQARKKTLKRKMNNAEFITENISEPQMIEDYTLFDPLKEDLNEFHELTEKQMRISERKKKVNQMATTFVDYVLTWCEVNKSFNHPQPYHTIFNELTNYKIFDLTKNQFLSVFSRFFQSENESIVINSSVNYFTVEHTVETQKKLVDLIYEEDIIPTDEQISKCSFLRLMLSQLYFIKKQQIDFQTKNNEIDFTNNCSNIEKNLDTEIVEGLLDMIKLISEQNKIIGNRLTQCLDKQNTMSSFLISNSNKVNKEFSDLKICFEKLSTQVIEISNRRRGLFG